MNKRIIFFLISIFIIIPSIYSTQLTIPKYIIKCDIPDKYFIQDFTCLNSNCSIRLDLTKDKNYLFLKDSKINQSIVYKNSFELIDISKNLDFIEQICNKNVNENELLLFKQKLNETINNNLNYNISKLNYEKLLISSYSDDNLKISANKRKKSIINYKSCYINDFIITENWIFEEIKIKSYCFLSSGEVKISQSKFFLYLLFHPSLTTLYYFFLIFLIAFILFLFYVFKLYLHQQNKLNKFLKINKFKLKFIAISIIPFFYLWGILINLILYEYYDFIYQTREIFFFIGLLILYYISNIIDYIQKPI